MEQVQAWPTKEMNGLIAKDLRVYKDGQKVVYTVTEDKVDNYTTKIDGTYDY